ncbi:hypothetical protein ACOM2C_10870 [Pseudarthrobacter sp. So.54]
MWGLAEAAVMMSSTATFRTSNASPISDRWQRHGTASAHMMAASLLRPRSTSSPTAAANSSVCI